MREVQKPITRVYRCVVIYSVAESRRTQGKSEATVTQTHSQRHSLTAQLTAQHLTPRSSLASACRPTSLPAEPSLDKPSSSTTRLRSKDKPRLNAIRAGATFRPFCCFLSGTRIPFYFYFSVLGVYWPPFLLQNCEPCTLLLAYKRSLCSD